MKVRRNEKDEPWAYYVLDQAGMPMALVDGSGEVLCEYERKVWGELVPRADARIDSPIRAQGQYADPEIGLFYNRHRYYDPQTGRYISPDPLGIRPDLNQYRYGDNPITDVDPFGLAPHVATGTLEDRRGRVTPIQNPQAQTEEGRFQFQSGWSGRVHDNYDQYIHDIRGEGATFGTCYRESHSEFKIMRELAGGDASKVNPALRGTTARISGGSRSCPNCAAALERFAAANQMRVVYDTPGAERLDMDFRPGRQNSNRVQYSQNTNASYNR